MQQAYITTYLLTNHDGCAQYIFPLTPKYITRVHEKTKIVKLLTTAETFDQFFTLINLFQH
jgi:hypothetical protein